MDYKMKSEEFLNETAQSTATDYHVYEFSDRGRRLKLTKIIHDNPDLYDNFKDFADEYIEEYNVVEQVKAPASIFAFITRDGGIIIAKQKLSDEDVTQVSKRMNIAYNAFLDGEEEAQADSDARERDPHGYHGVSPKDFM
jgi:hypothetical protein